MQLPRTQEQSLWQAIADLRREMRAIREARAGEIQRAYAKKDGTTAVTSVWPAYTTLCSVSVNIPSDQYRIAVSFAAHLDSPGQTSDAYLGFADDTADFASPVKVASFDHNFAVTHPQLAAPALPNIARDTAVVTPPGPAIDATATIWPDRGGFGFWAPYTTTSPTVGDHTYRLVGGTGTGGTANIIDAKLWVIVF